jgi:KAP family P-loop domain.
MSKYYLTLPKTEENFELLMNDRFADEFPGIIALEGPWGSGKSAFLDDFISNHKKNGDIPNLYITYNAWDNNDFGNPLMPLLLTMATQLERMTEIEDQAWAALKVSLNCLNKMLTMAIGALGKLDPRVSVGIETAKAGWSFFKKIKEEKERRKASNNALFSEIKSYTDLYRSIADSINAFCKQNVHLILVIDDLDRCLPAKQIELLESLHHISDQSKMLTIIAINPDSLQQIVTSYYGNAVMTAEAYLSKIINGRISIAQEERGAICERASNLFFNETQNQNGSFYSLVSAAIKDWCNASVSMTVRQAKKYEMVLDDLRHQVNTKEIASKYTRVVVVLIALVSAISPENIGEIIQNSQRGSLGVINGKSVQDFRSLFENIDRIENKMEYGYGETPPYQHTLLNPLKEFVNLSCSQGQETQTKKISVLQIILSGSVGSLDARIKS